MPSSKPHLMNAMHAFLRRAIVVAFLALSVLGQQPGLSPPQMMNLRRVLQAAPSPDGSVLAFLRSTPRDPSEPPGGSYTEIWITRGVPGSERRVVGGRRNVGSLAFSPDGKLITFLEAKKDIGHAEVFGLPLDGGEAVRITSTAAGVGSYAWRPDGTSLAYTATDGLPGRRAHARNMGFDQKVVDEDYAHVSLWLFDRASARSRRLTRGRTVNSFVWSPDGQRLAAGIAKRNLVDDQYMETRLHEIDVATGTVSSLVENPGKLGQYAWSSDGSRLAYVSAVDRRDPHAGMLYVVDRTTKEAKPLTEGFRGMVHQVEWLGDRTLLLATSRGVWSLLEELDLDTGKMTRRANGPGVAFHAFERAANGGDLFVVGSTAQHPEELWRVLGDSLERWTDSNPDLAEASLGRQKVTVIRARDGLDIEGLLIYPVGYREGERYPLVIVAHGGPESHFSHGWLTSYSQWGQLLAARGYVSWYPNYRASTGYGVEFAKMDHGDPMGREFFDHLDAIEAFVRWGLVDAERVGIGGGSYGGYTAAWAATRHSRHFAAAVSFVPFVDIRTKWYTSDIPNEFHRVHYQERWPHEQAEFLAKRSPLTFAEACKTPLLLLGGTSDPRVHPSQPFMLYRAVKTSTATPVRYVQYPGEGHGNRSNTHQYDYCLRTLRWFDHYLRPGDHRADPPPPIDLDYGSWAQPRR